MWISELNINDIRGFHGFTNIKLDRRMNLLVGRNNAGKSTILKLIHLLQAGEELILPSDIRVGGIDAQASIRIHNIPEILAGQFNRAGIIDTVIAELEFNRTHNSRAIIHNLNGQRENFNQFPASEPNNLIYPFLSKRKVTAYDQNVNKGFAHGIRGTLANLFARVDLLTSSKYPQKEAFDNACRDILGFEVSAFPGESGKKAGYIVNTFDNIPIEAMGDGVPHVLGLIASLCLAKDKIFLIEEPENDIHPQALKSLLELIIKKSENNQFIISTHSNIVTKYLGSIQEAKIHHLTSSLNQDNIPTTRYKEVGKTPEEKQEVLLELGYELSDYNLWDGWLFLEEATAEKLIREFLLPTFTPKISNKIKTVSSQGAEKAKDLFDEFYRLFLFTHLTPMYVNKAWVVLDGEETAMQTITRLRSKYTGDGKAWSIDNFRTFSKRDFEEYYPPRFNDKIKQVLSMPHGKLKQKAKTELLEEVLLWIKADGNAATEEFMESACEVIDILTEIEKSIIG